MKTIYINFTNALGGNAFEIDQYTHLPASFLYKLLDPAYASALHEAGPKPYSLSSVYGKRIYDKTTGMLQMFAPTIAINSVQDEIIDHIESRLQHGMVLHKGVKVKGWQVVSNRYADRINNKFDNDIVRTVSPICLRVNRKTYAPLEPDYWDKLTERTRNRLRETGLFAESDLDSFRVEADKQNVMKSITVAFHDKKFLCGYGVCRVYGTPAVRQAVYHIGLGGSCGCGFGALEIIS